MKNALLKISCAALFMLLFSQIALAQSSPLSAEAAPPTPVPPVTQIVVVTQEKEPATTTQTQQTSTKKPAVTQEEIDLNLPEPVLPVINLDGTQESQESTILPAATQPDIDTGSLSAKLITPVLGNQFKIILVVFLGAIVGTLITVLIMYLIHLLRKRSE